MKHFYVLEQDIPGTINTIEDVDIKYWILSFT